MGLDLVMGKLQPCFYVVPVVGLVTEQGIIGYIVDLAQT